MTYFESLLENGMISPVEAFRVLESTWIQQQHAPPSTATLAGTMAAAEVNRLEVICSAEMRIANQCLGLMYRSIDRVAHVQRVHLKE